MASLWAVPSFASWSTISLHVIPIHALIFSIVLLCLVYTIWWSMANMSNMVGWLSWDNGGSNVVANEVYANDKNILGEGFLIT